MASADLAFTSSVHFKRRPGEEEEEEAEAQPSPSAVEEDICRVCRAGPSPSRPLFYPCLCTGSIKYVHQDCLVLWLKHSGKEYCELCNHHFEFIPIYRPDMPRRLPLSDLLSGMTRGTVKNLRHWFHLSFVAFMWLIVVPICIYRIYRFLLYGSLWSITAFPLELFSLENLLVDDIYGLMIVFISLLGFISLVWLKDQLGNGRGPLWLENDHREVNRVRRQEAQERMNALRRHLEEAGKRAKERQNAPERVAAAKEVNEAHEILQTELKALELIQWEVYGRHLDDMRLREMELTYDLGVSQWKYQLILKSARSKKIMGLEQWRNTKVQEQIQTYRDEVDDQNAIPPEWPEVDHLEPPSDAELGLDFDEQGAIKVNDRARRDLSEEEMGELRSELEDLRERRKTLLWEHEQHQQKICRLLDHIGPPESPELMEVSPEESAIILAVREIKKELGSAQVKEKKIVDRQNNEERDRRNQVEERMNRWYNRLLGRHQDDPMVLAQRRRNQRQRPNIGQALVGLAREQPPDQVNQAGENAEEVTWARLLGLDGSFRFLEHVIWMIVLNSALIIAFVYLPYQLGWFTAAVFSLWDWLGIVTWRGVISTFVGYIVAASLIMGFYYGTGLIKQPRMKSILGVTFIAIKVGLILTVEAGIFPLMCGWWIDICSFALFGSTLKGRQESLQSAPGTVMFLHWLAGMIFVFYLASFVMLLREILRPGVLWFLRNLNDQNFHPVHEMISLPFYRHLRRFIMSCMMFGVCVMIVLLVPSKIVAYFFKDFLPFNLTLSSSVSPIREVQLELILLQFVVPALLEHGNCRAGVKVIVHLWAYVAAHIFGLQSYLLDKPQTGGILVDLHENVLREVPYDPQHEGPIYTGPLQVLGPGFAPFKPYLRPSRFNIRMVAFLTYTALTSIICSMFLIIIPVAVGRFLMGLVGMSQVPEIYTAAIGLYTLWVGIRVGSALFHHVSQGVKTLARQVGAWSLQGLKCLVAGVLLFVVIPLLVGHLVDLILITPLRVPADRTPLFYPSTEWALGLLHTKCMCGAIWLTNIRFKRTLDQLYQAGVRNLNLTFIVKEVAWPVILKLSLCITIPYVVFMGLLFRLDVLPYEHCLLLYRYCFPAILGVIAVIAMFTFVLKQFKRLYNHVRNEKYLIGRQLMNYSSVDLDEEEPMEPVQESGEQ